MPTPKAIATLSVPYLLILCLFSATFQIACPETRNDPQPADTAHLANNDHPLPAIPLRDLFPLTLRSVSGYTSAEQAYEHQLGISRNAFSLNLRHGKIACQHKILLNDQQKQLIRQALMGIGFCKRKSHFRTRIADIPINTISIGKGIKKRSYLRHPRGKGNYSYLCKGAEPFYQSLKKVIATQKQKQKLNSCPDFERLLR